MRICVLMQEIQSLGGVQRVVTTMLNRLVELENCEVYIPKLSFQEKSYVK